MVRNRRGAKQCSRQGLPRCSSRLTGSSEDAAAASCRGSRFRDAGSGTPRIVSNERRFDEKLYARGRGAKQCSGPGLPRCSSVPLLFYGSSLHGPIVATRNNDMAMRKIVLQDVSEAPTTPSPMEKKNMALYYSRRGRSPIFKLARYWTRLLLPLPTPPGGSYRSLSFHDSGVNESLKRERPGSSVRPNDWTTLPLNCTGPMN